MNLQQTFHRLEELCPDHTISVKHEVDNYQKGSVTIAWSTWIDRCSSPSCLKCGFYNYNWSDRFPSSEALLADVEANIERRSQNESHENPDL